MLLTCEIRIFRTLPLEECETFEDLVKEIDSYIEYYNNFRGQWNLKKMTPVQYRNHLLN